MNLPDRKTVFQALAVFSFFLAVSLVAGLVFFSLLFKPENPSFYVLLEGSLAYGRVSLEFLVIGLLVYSLSYVGAGYAVLRGLIIAVFSVAILTQFFSLLHAGSLFRQFFLTQVKMIGFLVTFESVFLSIAVIGLPILGFEYLSKRFGMKEIDGKRRAQSLLLIVLMGGLWAVLQNTVVFRVFQTNYPFGSKPWVPSLAKALASNEYSDRMSRPPIELSEVDRKTAADFGLDGATESVNPLAGLNADVPLNVIVIFGESLNAQIMEAEKYPGIAPHLKEFREAHTSVKGYYNHAFPTISGVVGQLCSYYPYRGHLYWKDQMTFPKGEDTSPASRCLPKILAEHDYETYYFGSGPPGELFVAQQLQRKGIQHTWYFDELLQKFEIDESPERSGIRTLGGIGNSDRQMFLALTKFVEGKGEKPGVTPFFVGVSTLGTHPGTTNLPSNKMYKDGKNRILNAYHTFDYEFGLFWQKFLRSPRAEDTVVIVTADHAHGISADFKKTVPKLYSDVPFDEIPLYLYVPQSRLPKQIRSHSTSIDLAPTLLHLLGLEGVEHGFLGHSVFGERQKFSGSAGVIFGGSVLLVEPSGASVHHIDLDCEEGQACSLLKVISEHQRINNL